MYSFSSLHPLPSDGAKEGMLHHLGPNTGSQWTMKDNKGPLQWWLSLTRFRHIPISSNIYCFLQIGLRNHVERLIFDWYGRGSQILTWHMRYKQRFSPFTFRNTYLVNLRKSHDYCKKEAFLFGVQPCLLAGFCGRSADLHRSMNSYEGSETSRYHQILGFLVKCCS